MKQEIINILTNKIKETFDSDSKQYSKEDLIKIYADLIEYVNGLYEGSGISEYPKWQIDFEKLDYKLPDYTFPTVDC